MQKVTDLFEASAFNPCQLANLENGSAGFRIPEYQRPYDWSEENIDRLMSDVFSGFERLSHAAEASAFTFLGTVILVQDKKQEPKFKGRSFAVVDGQQRLTTLTLLACALVERLRCLKDQLPKLPAKVKEWLDIESDHIESALSDCIVGAQRIKARDNFLFPRLVRSFDTRADNIKDEELKSAVSRFLSAFGNFIESDKLNFEIPNLEQTREATKICENFHLIRQYLLRLNDAEWYAETDCHFLEAKKFQHGGCRKLWEKAEDVLGNDVSSTISIIEKEPQAHDYFRTLMLASYCCNCIALTTVTTSDESAAFDIFDALNTTGEPLTALETLKPQVIMVENSSKYGKYAGSRAEAAFNELDRLMGEDYPETSQKQNETKDLVVTFALYLQGRKVSRDLSRQRSELRRVFQSSTKERDGPSEFMEALSGVAKYRSTYWVPVNHGRINQFHSKPEEADRIKLLSAFISSMKTSLALPLLARYWIAGRKADDLSDYAKALEAVAAFLAIRRAATGGTDGIDSCFRDIMEEGPSAKKFGLCAGATHQNKLLAIPVLKQALREKIYSSKVKFSSKDEWVNHVADNPIYSHARPLARFLLFAATHQTGPDSLEPGLLTRTGFAPSDDRDYFSYSAWSSERYRTVEHVAPNGDKPDGWDAEIYANSRIKNTLGNLVLIPQAENSSISNAAWERKKIFFSALVSSKLDDRQEAISKAAREGMPLKKTTQEMILAGQRFSMLDGICSADVWDAAFIIKRSRRMAELAWDTLDPLLDEN